MKPLPDKAIGDIMKSVRIVLTEHPDTTVRFMYRGHLEIKKRGGAAIKASTPTLLTTPVDASVGVKFGYNNMGNGDYYIELERVVLPITQARVGDLSVLRGWPDEVDEEEFEKAILEVRRRVRIKDPSKTPVLSPSLHIPFDDDDIDDEETRHAVGDEGA